MFTKILVALSASSTDTVLASAIETARKHDAQIVALHVIDPTPCYIGAADSNFGLIVEGMQAHGRELVAHVKEVLDGEAHPAEVMMLTLPLSGMTIGNAIADMADETGADLILLGEKRSSLWHWLSEDVASEVMRCSGKPIQIAANGTTMKPARRTRAPWGAASVARI